MNIPAGSVSMPLAPQRSARAIVAKMLLNVLFLLVALAALGAHEHFKLLGQSTPALLSLVAAGGFGLMPVRALLGELLQIEGQVMHLIHGLGGLAVIGLASGGVISGGSVLTHGALAPFAIMGAAQALMHSDHPRTPEQAEAMRRFVTSLPEIQQFAGARDLTSPANAQRAIAVLSDLVAKAQVLGETELRSDPGFQSALQQATTRFGLSLGLDAIDHTIGQLAANPAASQALPDLRRRLAAARRTVDGGAAATTARGHAGGGTGDVS